MKLIILHTDSGLGIAALMHEVHFLHSPAMDVIVLGMNTPHLAQPPKPTLEEVLKLHSRRRINLDFEPFEIEMGPELINGPCYNEFMARHYRGLGAGRKFVPKEKNYLCRKK